MSLVYNDQPQIFSNNHNTGSQIFKIITDTTVEEITCKSIACVRMCRERRGPVPAKSGSEPPNRFWRTYISFIEN